MAQGNIKKWNDDKGFGFISSAELDNDIFCHISAFKNKPKTLRPAVGDSVTFQVKTTPKGLQASNVFYPVVNNYQSEPVRKTNSHNNFKQNNVNNNSHRHNNSNRHAHQSDNSIIDLLKIALGVLAIIVIVYVSYQIFFADEPDNQHYIDSLHTETTYVKPTNTSTNNQKFTCDGRQHCSQMTSLSEARFFTHHCPHTKMDGNGDGEPCENDSRWR